MSDSERDLNNGFDDAMSQSFRNWETPVPEGHWNEINGTLDLQDALSESFRDWETPVPSTHWNEISGTLDLHEALHEDEEVFGLWDPETEPDFWDKLNQSISQISPEESMQEAYREWDVVPPASNWDKIDESLEMERVWERVKMDLYPQVKNNLFLKISTLCLLLIIGNYTTDSFPIYSRSAIETPAEIQLAASGSELVKTVPNPSLVSLQKHIQNPLLNVGNHTVDSNLQTNNKPDLTYNPEFNPANTYERLTPRETRLLSADRNFNRVALAFLPPATLQNPDKFPNVRLGLYASNSVNMIMRSDLFTNMNTFRSSYGYEVGIFASHRLFSLEQEYFFNYSNINQYENNYKNGSYNEDKLKLTSLKFNTFTTVKLGNHFTPGAGLSLLFPLNAFVTRGETVVEMPKLNPINVGYVVGFDFQNRLFQRSNRMVFGLKYEQIFATNQKLSYFKSFQNLSLGIKFKF